MDFNINYWYTRRSCRFEWDAIRKSYTEKGIDINQNMIFFFVISYFNGIFFILDMILIE